MTKPPDFEELKMRLASLTQPPQIDELRSRLAEITRPPQIEELQSRLAALTSPPGLADLQARLASLTKAPQLEELQHRLVTLTTPPQFDELRMRMVSTLIPGAGSFLLGGLEASRALNALAHANSATLQRVADNLFDDQGGQSQSGLSVLQVSDFADLEIGESAASVEDEVVAVLDGASEASSLSSAARLWLQRFLIAMFLLMNYLAAQNGVREELCFIQPKLMPGHTLGQTGKAIRSALCATHMPEEMLRNYRLVEGVGVRLRTAPSIKSDIVQVALADRAVLEVLDSSNRDWLYVSVIAEDGITGWISRKYTYQLMR